MQKLILSALVFLSVPAFSKVEVLFHPHDPTLIKIADWIGSAKSSVDIAMYNMDMTDESPIMQKLKSPEVQSRLKSGELKIRIIFEGYGGLKNNQERLTMLESLGLDARYMGKTFKVHHKIAVIDTDSDRERVVTGSANWSLSSYKGYNENILFFENEAEISYRYQTEFNRLWKSCFEFGVVTEDSKVALKPDDQKDYTVFFNSPRHLKLKVDEQDSITDQIVRGFDSAKSEIHIATTRIISEPILQALRRAADRGVQIQILINQDDFRHLDEREPWLGGSPNIHLRVKFFNLKVKNYMSYQMHNKFMIIDGKKLMTGSFNWSFSSENLHIESLIEISGATAKQLIPVYMHEFGTLWEMGRPGLEHLKEKLAEQKSKGEIPLCAFDPVAMEVPEITFLITEYANCFEPPKEPKK